MQKEAIVNIVNAFLIDEFELEPEQIKSNASLKDELDLESLDMVDIIVLIEKEFEIKPEPSELVKVNTVEDLYNFITKRVKN